MGCRLWGHTESDTTEATATAAAAAVAVWSVLEKRVAATAAAAKSLQSCPTLCDPTDGSPPGSPDPGILQARTLEWVAISSHLLE